MSQKQDISKITQAQVLGKSGALVYTAAENIPAVDKKATPTTVKLKTPDTKTVKEIKFASWGSNNDKPNLIIADIESIPASARALEKRVEATYGLGPFYYRLDYDDSGKEIIVPVTTKSNKDMFTFLKSIRHYRFVMECLFDMEGLRNIFPEFILTNDYEKVKSIRHQEAKHCRFSVMEKGMIKYCGISSEWGSDEPVTAENCTVVMVADPWMTVDEVKAWAKKNKIKKFIYPASIPSLGKTYYQSPPHEAARNAGWNDVAKRIASLIKNTLKNGIRIQWHVKIPYDYWEKEFPEHKYKGNEAQREADMKKVLEDLDNFLAGDENAGKTFRSHYGKDPVTQKDYPGWIIDKLDSSIKFDKDILATSTANSEILMAWGVDPATVGVNQLGQNNGQGSGSDKREADLIFKSNNISSHAIGEPILFALEYNGLGDDIHFGFRKEILTTLDKNPTGSQKQAT